MYKRVWRSVRWPLDVNSQSALAEEWRRLWSWRSARRIGKEEARRLYIALVGKAGGESKSLDIEYQGPGGT